tara:strand:+ start:934 stop:1167 length:234 start_codon:yes stop_codon:yes gene_type:complete
MMNFQEPIDTFSSFEIKPLKDLGQGLCEQCAPEEANFWSVYTKHLDNTLQCIADVPTKDEAKGIVAFLKRIIDLHRG